MSLSQTPSQGWDPYCILDRRQPSFLLYFQFQGVQALESSSFYCQMALLTKLIFMLSRVCLLGTSTFWVKFCPVKQHKRFSIHHSGKWQIMSNLEGSGHSLAVGNEVEIFLSDLGRVKVKYMHDKGMIWLSKFRLRKDRCPENKTQQNKRLEIN